MAHPNRDLELWNKLAGLPLDRLAEEAPAEFGFVKRLMRDEKWDYATAIRVTAEYRRFVFLAAAAPASPSEMVDAAWHLHLTHTRAYNTGLCERTLGRALDHTPSNGPDDSLHYRAVYAETLERYRATFGEEAPEDIWPPAQSPEAAQAAPPRHPARRWLVGLGTLALLAGFIWLFMRWPLVAGAGAIITASIAGKNGKWSAGADFGGDGDGGGGDGCGGGCGGGCG